MFLASGGVLVGALRAFLGNLGDFLGPLGAILGRLGAVLSRLRTILSRLHALLGPQEAEEGQIVDFPYVFVRSGAPEEFGWEWSTEVARLRGGVRGGDIIM